MKDAAPTSKKPVRRRHRKAVRIPKTTTAVTTRPATVPDDPVKRTPAAFGYCDLESTFIAAIASCTVVMNCAGKMMVEFFSIEISAIV